MMPCYFVIVFAIIFLIPSSLTQTIRVVPRAVLQSETRADPEDVVGTRSVERPSNVEATKGTTKWPMQGRKRSRGATASRKTGKQAQKRSTPKKTSITVESSSVRCPRPGKKTQRRRFRDGHGRVVLWASTDLEGTLMGSTVYDEEGRASRIEAEVTEPAAHGG